MVHIKTTEKNLARFYVISSSYLASILGTWKICMHLHNRQLIGCINKEFCLEPDSYQKQLKKNTDAILQTLLSKNKDNAVFPLKRVT